MSKQKKFVSYSDLIHALNAGKSTSEVAKEFGVSKSTIYKAWASRSKGPASVSNPRTAASVFISLRMADSEPAEVQVRDSSGTLLGTLVLTATGVSYRRPKQKSNGERTITWSTLEKIIALGIA